MLRPYVITAHRRRSRDSDAPAVTHAEIRPRFFGGTGRLESPPFEGDRRPLEPTPQPIGAAVGAAPGQIDEPRDHAFPTAPPNRASSIRTCGDPSVTESGEWPAVPHQPPHSRQRMAAPT